MTSTTERTTALHLTRVVICILGSAAMVLSSPAAEALGIVSLIGWLWMPNLIKWELQLLDKYRPYTSSELEALEYRAKREEYNSWFK